MDTGFGWNKAIQAMHGPAPKDERMEGHWHNCLTAECREQTFGECARFCNDCINKQAAELRAVYERAFWAGIANDLCMEFAHRDALVIVRQWPAMQAELDALIGEMST